MTATQYFTTPKLQIKKANWEKSVMRTAKEVLIKDFKAQHAPIKEQECHRLNHIIVTFLSREIADSLLVLSERRLISTKDIKYFEKLASELNTPTTNIKSSPSLCIAPLFLYPFSM